jgi:hypothetical protein
MMDIKTLLRIKKGNFQPDRRFEGGQKYSVLDSTLSINKCEQVDQRKLNFCQHIITKTEQEHSHFNILAPEALFLLVSSINRDVASVFFGTYGQ